MSLLSQLEGRLGTIRRLPAGEQRSFEPDLPLSFLVGVSSDQLRTRLGPPLLCRDLPESKRNRVCRGSEWVYRFFSGRSAPRETYLVVDPGGGSTIRSARWRLVP